MIVGGEDVLLEGRSPPAVSFEVGEEDVRLDARSLVVGRPVGLDVGRNTFVRVDEFDGAGELDCNEV